MNREVSNFPWNIDLSFSINFRFYCHCWRKGCNWSTEIIHWIASKNIITLYLRHFYISFSINKLSTLINHLIHYIILMIPLATNSDFHIWIIA